MQPRSCLGSVLFSFLLALVACGGNENAKILESLQEDLRLANATIDSLNYTIDASNQLIDQLRARADSLQQVDERLLESIQQLNREVREWRQLAMAQKQKNDQLTAEIEQMKRERQADQRAIARLRAQADSLNSELLAAHSSLRRQSDYVRKLEGELTQAQKEVADLRKAQMSVRIYAGTEQELEAKGYLEVSRLSPRSTRKTYKLLKKIDPADPDSRLLPIGEGLTLQRKPKLLIDRYGQLKKGQDYREVKEEGQVVLVFPDDLMAGADILVVFEE